MKIIRKKESDISVRDDGRKVSKLYELNFETPTSSMVFYHCEVPLGKFTEHYHQKSTEVIFFPLGGKMEINGDIYEFNSWDGVLLEPGDTHGYDGIDCDDIVHFAIRTPSLNDKVETK